MDQIISAKYGSIARDILHKKYKQMATQQRKRDKKMHSKALI
jgi:hypothetical protein